MALAKASAEVTHNHPDGIAGACVVAGAVYLARVGGEQGGHRRPRHPVLPLDFTLDEIREDYAFDVTCAGSVPQAMEAFLEAESFEDALRGAVSIGGDSDTIASMAGAVAAAFTASPGHPGPGHGLPGRGRSTPSTTGSAGSIEEGSAMWNTTLCYIEREGQYLMLHRVKKENDINKDKWIGIGGQV